MKTLKENKNSERKKEFQICDLQSIAFFGQPIKNYKKNKIAQFEHSYLLFVLTSIFELNFDLHNPNHTNRKRGTICNLTLNTN